LVDWLIPDHVESVGEVMWRELAFLIRALSGAISVALLAELPLLVCFSVNDRLIGADIENEVSTLIDREARETRRIRW